ncbi:MAG: kinase [Rhizobiales bacterium]|jgi:uncharacterized protein involved in propanediol utilization|nr:kinase [Hyphomicrobiales bacterium]
MASPGVPQRTRSNNEGEYGPRPQLQVGIGRAIAHHGELLQGVFEGDDDHLHRGLVTLPLPIQQVIATFWPRQDDPIRTRPRNRPKAARAVALTLKHLGFEHWGGDLTIESGISIGYGYGSSTADVVAAIRAIAAASSVVLCRSTICRLAIAAEEASDAIVYGDQAVLFAHREGTCLEHFGGALPPLLVVGFRDGSSAQIDTLRLPRVQYSSEEIQLFKVLRALVFRSVREQNPHMLGRVATTSAEISQRHLPKPHWEAVSRLAAELGALGVQVAHSGTLFGILLDPDKSGAAATAARLAKTVKREGFKDVQTFALNAEGTWLP